MDAVDNAKLSEERDTLPGQAKRYGTSTGVFTRVRRQVGWPVLGVFVGMILIATFATLISPYDPNAGSLTVRLVRPFTSAKHVLGTDPIGRDELSRLLYGARISLFVGFSSVAVAVIVGSLLGLIAGFYGGWLDDLLMRLGDMQLSFPSFILAISIMAVLGASLFNVILALSIGGWVRYARVVRSTVLPLKEVDFVQSAFAIGCRKTRVMLRHVLPNTVAPVIILATLALGQNIIAESSLSYLGLGVGPSTPSWGSMLSEGRPYLTSAWWVAAFPGIAISVVVLVVNLIGDALRDQLDPRARQVQS